MYKKYLEQFKDPLILLLLGSAVLSLLIKQYDDALSIFMAVAIVATVSGVATLRVKHHHEGILAQRKGGLPRCAPGGKGKCAARAAETDYTYAAGAVCRVMCMSFACASSFPFQ